MTPSSSVCELIERGLLLDEVAGDQQLLRDKVAGPALVLLPAPLASFNNDSCGLGPATRQR